MLMKKYVVVRKIEKVVVVSGSQGLQKRERRGKEGGAGKVKKGRERKRGGEKGSVRKPR